MAWDTLPVVWIVLAVLLIGTEMLTGTFYLLVMGLAAVAGGLAAWAGAPLPLQIVLAVVVATIGAFLVRYWHKNRTGKDTEMNNNMELGQTVVWKSTYPDGTWQVRYRGTQWKARPTHPEVDPNKLLIISETQGNLLIVDNKPSAKA